MEIFLLLMLLFPGVCGLSYSVPRQFHVVKEEKMNWTEAQQYCREEFTDLATIDNMADMEEIRREMQDAGVGEGWEAWIGLNQGRIWQWSLTDTNVYEGNEAEFRNWNSGEPNGWSAGQECVGTEKEGRGRCHDLRCPATLPFICYNGTDSTHPYVLIKEGKNWTEAQAYCREKHTDLASVRNQTENEQIRDLIRGLRLHVWIGLFRHAWEWSDGSSSSFRHWAPGEPSYGGNGPHCTLTNFSGLWNAVGCHHTAGFICYQDLPDARAEVVTPQSPFYSGDVVTLRCDITNYSDWQQYVWLKDSTPVPGKTNQTITITLPLEAGQYQCSGERNDRPKTSSVSSSVDIISNARVKRTQMVRVEMEASDDVNMEDPDVQKAFLQQIRDRLKAKGFKGDVKLSWKKQPDGKVFHKKKNDKKKKKRDEL